MNSLQTTLVGAARSTLDALLRQAAAEPDWAHVTHRCAWCGRFLSEQGQWTFLPAPQAPRITTDGMCTTCGMRAMVEVATRTPLRARLAA
jgi:hypothetical protein